MSNEFLDFAGLTEYDTKLKNYIKSNFISPEMHRNIYRGKNLGSYVTLQQKEAIYAGTFDDLYVGDYWIINNMVWRIADIDYWYNIGDTPFTEHHLVIMPETILYTHVMNDTNIIEGGYAGSKLRQEGLDEARTIINAAFENLVLTHRDYLTTTITDGYVSAGAWFDSDVDLMSETMVYGSYICCASYSDNSILGRLTANKQQLAIFKLNPKAANIRIGYWLRDIVSDVFNFTKVSPYGFATVGSASFSNGVLPVFAIGGDPGGPI